MKAFVPTSNLFIQQPRLGGAAFRSLPRRRGIHGRLDSAGGKKEPQNPLAIVLGRAIEDDYARIRSQYRQSSG
jgi:hypothetical protein